MTVTGAGSMLPAGEIEMYVELEGEGRDLVLLHGGGGTTDDLAGLRSALRHGRRIIAPEQRGHGRTPDVGELSYAQMAVDTAALLDGLGVAHADLLGWSDGGIVALMVARDRPDLVRRVVAIGSNVADDGAPSAMSEENRSWAATATPADLPFEIDEEIGKRLLAMWRAGPEITVADLSNVTTPVLLISGDRDVITLEHTLAMYQALPDTQLAVVPGGTHRIPQSRSEAIAAMAIRFFDDTPEDEPDPG